MCAGASETGGKRAEALRDCGFRVLPQENLFGKENSCKNIDTWELLYTSKGGQKPNHGEMPRKMLNQASSLSFLIWTLLDNIFRLRECSVPGSLLLVLMALPRCLMLLMPISSHLQGFEKVSYGGAIMMQIRYQRLLGTEMTTFSPTCGEEMNRWKICRSDPNFSRVFCNKPYFSHWSLGAMAKEMSNINICKSSFSGPQITASNREHGERADLELKVFLMFHGVLFVSKALQFSLFFFFPVVRYPQLFILLSLFLSPILP